MYSITNYAEMLADVGRREAFVAAMRESIRPGDVVLDLGAGFGALSLLACKMGAARVYAIEPNAAVRALPRLAQHNGVEAGRIQVFCDDSRKVTLPEQVDVIIADLRSFLPLFGGTWDVMNDACARFLKPGGKVIPFRDTLTLVPLAQEKAHADYRLLWDEHGLGVDFGYARELAMCRPRRALYGAEHMLAQPTMWGQVAYGNQCQIDVQPDMTFEVTRDGLFDGIGMWFDMAFSPSVHLSNDPRKGRLIYGAGFFPVPKPVQVHVGDVIHVSMAVRNLPDREFWSWGGRVVAPTGETRLHFSASNLPLVRLELEGSPGAG